jgi:hypothetical protein
MSETEVNIERDQRNGRFVTGNIGGGRPKGARSKLGELFLENLRDAWEEHGVEALRRCATESPDVFVKVISNLLPRDVNLNLEISATEFAGRFATAMQLLGNAPESPLPRRPLREIMHAKAIDRER